MNQQLCKAKVVQRNESTWIAIYVPDSFTVSPWDQMKMNIKGKGEDGKETRKVPFQCQCIEQYSHAQTDSEVQFPESEKEVEWENI